MFFLTFTNITVLLMLYLHVGFLGLLLGFIVYCIYSLSLCLCTYRLEVTCFHDTAYGGMFIALF